MQADAANMIVRTWERVATRASDTPTLFVALRDDVAGVLMDLIADEAVVIPTDPVTLAILTDEAILCLTISEEARRRITVELWPTSTTAIEATMVDERVDNKHRRTWTFRQGDKRVVTIAHQRAAHTAPDEEERRKFAFRLARRLGWPIPDNAIDV